MEDLFIHKPLSRRQFQQLAALWIPAALTGCGTLMYPERRGQGRGGRIDWTVAGMDAIGLVLFFIPGVIAFGVDYYNGTLFFPEETGAASHSRPLRTLKLSSQHPTLEEIAQAVSTVTGRTISLAEETYVTRPLDSVDEFWSTQQALIAQFERGELVLRCQSP